MPKRTRGGSMWSGRRRAHATSPSRCPIWAPRGATGCSTKPSLKLRAAWRASATTNRASGGIAMKKLINARDGVLTESLAGLAAAHADIVSLGAEDKFVRRRELQPGKVALISGGGSGHEPLHAGFVGYGMLDAACPGQVFTSPTPDQIVAAAGAVDSGQGRLFIVKNYAGDVMNFEMAAESLDGQHATVLVQD